MQVDPDWQQVAPAQPCPPHWPYLAEHYIHMPKSEFTITSILNTQLDGLGKGKLTLPLDGGVEVEEEVVGGGLVVDEPPSDTVMEEGPCCSNPR